MFDARKDWESLSCAQLVASTELNRDYVYICLRAYQKYIVFV